MVHSIDNHKSSVASTTPTTNPNSNHQNHLHHRYPSTTGGTNHRTTNTNPNTISSHKSSIVSYGSITEMSTLQEETQLVTTTATTTTPTLSNQNQNHHHRRRSTNTDIASIFQNFSIPNIFLSRNSTTSNVVAAATTTTTATTVPSESNHSVLSYNITNIIVDNDNEDNEYPALLLLPTTTVSTTNTMTSSRHEMRRLCCFCNDANTRRSHSDNYTTTTTTPMIISMAPGAILNLCSATLGAGILALPYTLLQSGFIYGTILLFIAAIATERSIYILISVIHHSNCNTMNNNNTNNPMAHTNNSTNHCNSYESLTENVLDKRSSSSTISTRKYTTISYRRTIEIAMLFFCCGCAIGYIMAIMDILEQFHLLFIYNSRQYTIIVVWLVAMVPLSLLQNVQSLQYASAIGIMAIGTLIVAAFVHYIQHPHPQHDGPLSTTTSSDASNVTVLLKLLSHWRNILLNGTSTNMDNTDHVSLMDFLWPINGWVSILTSGPVVLFAFSCQPNVCSIYDELVVNNDHDDDNQRPSEHLATRMNDTASLKKLRLMHRVTIVAVCICAILYCSISVIALADFGKNVQPNILSCYSHDDTGTNGGSSSSSTLTQIATAAMALAIVMAFPLNIFPARVTLIGLWHNYCQQRQLAAVAAASSNNSLDRSISLHGIVQPHEGLTAALLDGEVTNTENVSSHRSLVSSPLTNGNYHEIETPENFQSAITNVSDNHPPFNRTVHVVSTMFLTTSTLLLALILPNISVVFGLLGGTASSWLGFCVPGLLGIQLSKNERSSGQPSRYGLLLTSWALLIGGVIVGVLTTGVTIYNTMKH